ncbi:DNA polymerase IV [Aeromonas schubertii]|uniref:DNA polymerase IV n=1 Tax=Aeromonas schubertii TaxID=652 RepID=A0ABS7VFF6_9GAMM|nr:DNA polymerase IV [Aeromonas schubertii]MBZ6067701.1 DNA polymerase IV [Aeromonas schubertii]
MGRKIIHIDMDCFYAAVEMRDDPALREVPMAIGGSVEHRGVISTCNYVARRFGVRSAMPTAVARRLCPPLVLLPGRLAYYKEVSGQLHDIFRRYTSLIEPLSLDEAYLDVTECPLLGGSATRIAAEIRERIREELALTASAGVAPNKFLAKIGSERNKPDGQFVIAPHQVDEFVCQLPLSQIPGVGRKSAERMAALGFITCEDLRALDLERARRLWGKPGEVLLERAWGRDERPVAVSRERKSVGVETTLDEDLPPHEPLVLTCLEALWPELLRRLERHQGRRPVRGVGIKLKFADFQQTTVYRSCERPDAALLPTLLREGLLRARGRGIRLVGVVVGVGDSSEQLALDL